MTCDIEANKDDSHIAEWLTKRAQPELDSSLVRSDLFCSVSTTYERNVYE